VACWRAQNEAIRSAFGAPSRARALNLGGPSNENATTVRTGLREALGAPRSESPQTTEFGDNDDVVLGAGGAMRRPALWAAVFCATIALFPSGGPPDFRGALIDKGVAAYRAFAAAPSPPLDYATNDPDELRRDLGPRFRAFDLANRTKTPGWTLLGARIAPGVYGAAAFALIENSAGRRVGLLIEPLDAPPSTTAKMAERGGLFSAALTTGGFGLAVVGPADATGSDMPPRSTQ
jgi:hypothetical protein